MLSDELTQHEKVTAQARTRLEDPEDALEGALPEVTRVEQVI